MNILFLDCDGVINTIDGKLQSKNDKMIRIDGIAQHAYYNKKTIPQVNMLCDRYSLKVVVSSTWRKDFPINYLKLIFQTIGLTIQVIDITVKILYNMILNRMICEVDKYHYG